MSEISYATSVKSLLRGAKSLLFIAPKGILTSKWCQKVLPEDLSAVAVELAAQTSPGDLGQVSQSLTQCSPGHLRLGVLPDRLSRYNSPSRAECIRRAVVAGSKGEGKLAILVVVDEDEHMMAAVNAIGRALPLYSARTGTQKGGSGRAAAKDKKIVVTVLNAKGESVTVSPNARMTVECTRAAARWVDMPTAELNPATFAAEARKFLRGVANVKIKEIVGSKLVDQGMMGIHSVGRAAVEAPRMVICSYTPPRVKKNARHVALVGKGICFDTGGLHLKMRGSIEGMKMDMGGAAAVLGAFKVAASESSPHRISLILCLAENAIGPDSYRPDDILHLHSGKSVEINNTDAEGRLLLADGVSYAARKLGADTIIDAATLTGAQMIATGLLHAAVFSNDENLEQKAVEVGRKCGDMVHPLMFAPELYREEFPSKVADMTNTGANRLNAQSSCAAQFVYWQIDDQEVSWMHVDLAGPTMLRGRGTGFGVALLSSVLRELPPPNPEAPRPS